MLYRKRMKLEEVQVHFEETLEGVLPMELAELLQFIRNQRAGKLGRAREAVRAQPAKPEESGQESKAA